MKEFLLNVETHGNIFLGATTFESMTLSISTLGIRTLGIRTLSIRTHKDIKTLSTKARSIMVKKC
jgi:hypothetical protein